MRRALFDVGHCRLVFCSNDVEVASRPIILNRVFTPKKIARDLACEVLPFAPEPLGHKASGVRICMDDPDLKNHILQGRKKEAGCQICSAYRSSALSYQIRFQDGTLAGYYHDHCCAPPIPEAERTLKGQCTQC